MKLSDAQVREAQARLAERGASLACRRCGGCFEIQRNVGLLVDEPVALDAAPTSGVPVLVLKCNRCADERMHAMQLLGLDLPA